MLIAGLVFAGIVIYLVLKVRADRGKISEGGSGGGKAPPGTYPRNLK